MSASLVGSHDDLAALIAGLPGAVDAYLAATADEALGVMQGFTPVDTGELRDSEHVEHPDTHTYDVVAGTNHAYVVHFGTERMPARPFIVWTADSLREAFQAGAADILPGLLR